MDRCAVCGRALTNPVSMSAGIGPICRGRLRLKRETTHGRCSDMFMPDFSYIVRDGVLVIYDDNLGGCSVTNGAEAVIEQIRRENPGALSLPVIYRDSAGVYDELVVEYGAFKGFGDLCVTSEDTAIEMVTC